jgi:Reverse transcriptase (RNA-dependent DNA polymerase)
MAETYATCVAQPACRLYWAITASAGLISIGADAGNAFAEAPPPVEPFYMVIDDQFHEWWVECLGNSPIPAGYVLPVQHALQGHPESPRLWETHIHTILVDHLNFTPTTHEKCLYSKREKDGTNLQLLLRQVDDFSVSAKDRQTCENIIAEIGTYLQVPLNDLGLIKKFNGVNILQTRWYIKVSCEDYITRILNDHNWLSLKAANLPVPMRSDPAYQRQLETVTRPTDETAQNALQAQAGFSYRMATGELIYALVAARPEISFATTKLTQYGSSPALTHYQAVKLVYAFLNNTKADGLIFWRSAPRMDLPDIPFPELRSNPQDTCLPQRCTQVHPWRTPTRIGERTLHTDAQ